jgi:pimeloyl-ACP methyl ester carboxylesterase
VASFYEYRLELGGHATRALETTGAGPGIVLLHGWGDSADTWRRLLEELARHGRRAIAVDLPGFGGATRLGQGPILPQLDAFVAELVLSWAGEERVVLAGSSLGGCVALRLAGHGSALPLAGVVPVAPAGLEPAGWFDAIEHDPLVRRLLALPIAVPKALVGRTLAADPELAQRSVVEALGWRHALPELFAAPFDLAAIECPVLLVWGSRDRVVPHTDARHALDAFPSTHVELIEGCGHHPQLEATGRLLELLLQFPGP